MRFATTIVSNGDSTIATGAESLIRTMACATAGGVMATRLASGQYEAFTTVMASQVRTCVASAEELHRQRMAEPFIAQVRSSEAIALVRPAAP